MDGAELSRRALSAVLAREPLDVARAALAVAREEYPELDEGAYLKQLDALAATVRSSLPQGASAERKVGRLNTHLFHDVGFDGNTADYYDPKNSFLNEVLDRKVGIPITLSIVYFEVARRCGLRAEGVAFPGHFLCKILLDGGELFVDPFHRGQLVGLEDLEQRLLQAAGPEARLDARLLRPARPRDIVLRLLQNLQRVYAECSDWPRALSAADRMVLVAPDDGRLLRQRAVAYEKLGGTSAATNDLERVLALEPAAKDAGELRERIHRLRGTASRLN